MTRQRVDMSAYSALALCECGWRSLQGDRATAWGAAHRHALASHPGDAAQASKNYANALRRG